MISMEGKVANAVDRTQLTVSQVFAVAAPGKWDRGREQSRQQGKKQEGFSAFLKRNLEKEPSSEHTEKMAIAAYSIKGYTRSGRMMDILYATKTYE